MKYFKSNLSLLTSIFFLGLFILTSGCGGDRDKAGVSHASPIGAVKPQFLKITSTYPLNVPILGENIKYLAEKAEKGSGGTLKFKIFGPNELVGPLEILEAVSSGKVEAGYSAAGFWKGKLPAAPLFATVPFGPDITEFMAWLFAGDGMKLYQEMYDNAGFNVKVLVCSIIPPETSGWFKTEINSSDDLKGLKMRFYGLGGDVMAKLGVAVKLIPGPEVYNEMEKGIIDATEYSMPVIDENLELFKLAKYNYFPGWHQQATTFELLINKDTWEKLHPSQQTVIEMACRDSIVNSVAQSEARQAPVMKKAQNEHGVIITDWSPEMLKTFRKAWLEVVQEQKERDAFFAKVWDNLEKFRQEYKVWGERAYLPR